MRFDQPRHPLKRALNDRQRVRRRANMMQPTAHPLPDNLNRPLRPALRIHHLHDPLRRRALIIKIGPAIMKHRLVDPLVGIILNHRRQIGQRLILWPDAGLRVLSLQPFNDRGGILQRKVVRPHQHWDQRQAGELGELGLARRRPRDPAVLDPFEAHIIAHLDRIGRQISAKQAIGSRH